MEVTPSGGPEQSAVAPAAHRGLSLRCSTARGPGGSFSTRAGRAHGLDSRHAHETTRGAVHDPDGDVGGAHTRKGIPPCTAGAAYRGSAHPRAHTRARAQSPSSPSLIARDLSLHTQMPALTHPAPRSLAACNSINLVWLRKGLSIPAGWPSCVVTYHNPFIPCHIP